MVVRAVDWGAPNAPVLPPPKGELVAAPPKGLAAGVAAAPNAGLFWPNSPPPDVVFPPPKGEAVVFVAPNPPKPELPDVAVPPDPNIPPVEAVVPNPEGFAPKALLLFVAPNPPVKYNVSTYSSLALTSAKRPELCPEDPLRRSMIAMRKVSEDLRSKRMGMGK